MSDEDKDIDIESDDDEDSVSGNSGLGGGRTDLQFASQAEKRAHHNALERKRRDHIKDSFCSLRDSVPSLQGEKVRKTEKEMDENFEGFQETEKGPTQRSCNRTGFQNTLEDFDSHEKCVIHRSCISRSSLS